MGLSDRRISKQSGAMSYTDSVLTTARICLDNSNMPPTVTLKHTLNQQHAATEYLKHIILGGTIKMPLSHY